MLRIFKKQSDEFDVLTDEALDALQPESVRELVHKTSEDNPYIHQKVTGRELHTNIVEALREETSGRAETALGVMASLAGFSCLSSVYLKYERGEISPDEEGFGIHVTQTGRRIFYGSGHVQKAGGHVLAQYGRHLRACRSELRDRRFWRPARPCGTSAARFSIKFCPVLDAQLSAAFAEI